MFSQWRDDKSIKLGERETIEVRRWIAEFKEEIFLLCVFIITFRLLFSYPRGVPVIVVVLDDEGEIREEKTFCFHNKLSLFIEQFFKKKNV